MISDFRSKIKPFPTVAVYPTSWAGDQTFEQIHDDLAHYTSNVMKRYGFLPYEIPDCLQIGFMVLWETLSAQRDFLAQKTRRQAVFFILARCKISTMRYQEDRYDSLDAMISNNWRNTADEHTIDGMQHRQGERWAGWATEIDMRIDIERIMHKLADKYADSIKHLAALYHVTTQVSRNDAAMIAGTTPYRWHKAYVIPMIQEVQYEFAHVFMEHHGYTMPEVEEPAKRTSVARENAPHRAWRVQYRCGRTAPAEALLARYRHTPCLILALEAQIAGKSYQKAAQGVERNPNTFRRHMKRAARLLKEVYAQ